MAGDWIKMRLDLPEDPAVIEMADSLDVREEVIVGYCHAFWSWVSRQCHDGSVTGVTLAALGRRLNLPGFPELLVSVGWLEYSDSNGKPVIKVPNFERHLSQGAKARALASNRKTKQRAASVTELSLSGRDKNVTREEKRREEEIYIQGELATDEFRAAFDRFSEFVFVKTGRKLDAIRANVLLMELKRRGVTKAIKDLDFSISVDSTNLKDSDNDYSRPPSKQSEPRRSPAPPVVFKKGK